MPTDPPNTTEPDDETLTPAEAALLRRAATMPMDELDRLIRHVDQVIDPLFMGGANGDLRLDSCSQGTDAGDDDAVPAGASTDLGDNPRFVDDLTVLDTGNPGVAGPPVVVMAPMRASFPEIPR